MVKLKYKPLVENFCAAMACPNAYYSKSNGDYIIVGKKINSSELEDAGLVDRVGKDEQAVRVPKSLIKKLRFKRLFF